MFHGTVQAPAAATRLQQELVDRIIALIHEDNTALGSRVNENRLAERLAVSRSPVRAALNHLVSQGVLTFQPNRGMLLAARPGKPMPNPPGRPEDELLVLIARDRRQGILGEDISENDLIRRYAVPRPVIRGALTTLASLGIVERKSGYGWRLLGHWDEAARHESYAFRSLIEPAAIMAPCFSLSGEWIASMRARHSAILAAPWSDTTSIAFFDMNADFHEGLAQGSGNRHFHAAIRRQNQLRRFSNYYWAHGFERVRANHAEHMEILDRIEAGQLDVAAALMRLHLDIAQAMPF